RLPAGEVGELVVRGPHVAKLGYWRSPDETAARFRQAPEGNGEIELYTGDTGSVDADGFIYFEARADDLLKHRGNRISPIEIETEACALPGVVEGCVVKKKADDTLNLFVTRSDESLTDKDILEGLKAVLEPAKIPDRVHILDTMPKSMNGKIDRKALIAR
ncbi:MAG: AMP-binding protein, partial [Verrucomicrobiales bacterium]|nr:AMP-binding protein [Verrucomicrobiales bacterium]